VEEADRIMGVLDGRFAESEYAAGPEYTIADMALYPWCQQLDKRGLDLADYAHCGRWFEAVGARPAARKADEIAAGLRRVAAAAQ
jgi:GST-like protein